MMDMFFQWQAFAYPELFSELKYPWEPLNRLRSFFLEKRNYGIHSPIPEGVTLENKEQILIEEGCTIEPGAYIRGPAILCKGVEVRHGAYIRGLVVLGEGSLVGHDTEVKSSIFLNGAKAAHFAYVGDSILGNEVNLGAGTKLANLRFDKGMIKVWIEKELIATEQKKLGAIIGDGANTGCNSVLNPGTLLERGAAVAPGVVASGYIPANYMACLASPSVLKAYKGKTK